MKDAESQIAKSQKKGASRGKRKGEPNPGVSKAVLKKCKTGKEIQVNDIEESPSTSRSKAVSAKGSSRSPMIVLGYEKPTRVEFVEGGQIRSMTVDRDDERDEQDQASSAEEFDYEDVEQDISFHRSSQRESSSENSSDEEDEDNCNSDVDHDQADVSDGEINQSENEEVPSSSDGRSQRIKQIDREMCTKLKELQAML